VWRMELLEILRVLDVRDYRFTMPINSEQFQGDMGLVDARAVSEMKRRVQGSIDTETSSPVSFLGEDLVESAAHASPTPGPSLLLDSGERALQRLISSTVPESELASLIEAIFSSKRATDTFGGLAGRDAQTFIDTMDEVCRRPLPPVKNEPIVSYFVLLPHPDRCWRILISHRRSEGGASNHCTRCVPVTPCFLDHCGSSCAKTQRASRCTVVGLGMFTDVDIRGGMSQSRS